MPTGILKYKQDDGSIVELNPAGVDAEARAAADKANTNIGSWETDHPGQTISECVTSQENELTEHAGSIAKLEADKADKTAIPDVSGFVKTETYTAGQAGQDAHISKLESLTQLTSDYVLNLPWRMQKCNLNVGKATMTAAPAMLNEPLEVIADILMCNADNVSFPPRGTVTVFGFLLYIKDNVIHPISATADFNAAVIQTYRMADNIKRGIIVIPANTIATINYNTQSAAPTAPIAFVPYSVRVT